MGDEAYYRALYQFCQRVDADDSVNSASQDARRMTALSDGVSCLACEFGVFDNK